MSTCGLINVEDADGIYCTIYVHGDAYPDALGNTLLDFLQNKKIVNGLSGESNIFNGMGCLAASLVGYLKQGPGGVYLTYPVKSSEHDESYSYVISNTTKNGIGKIYLEVKNGKTICKKKDVNTIKRFK